MRASRSGVISCFVLFAFLTACGQKAAVENDAAPEAESATHRVSLKPADAARLGITVNDVSAAQYTPQMRGYGMVMALDAPTSKV